MPELPEVEVVKQSLEKYILNKILLKIIVKNKKLRFPVPNRISQILSNRRILKINRKSKYLIIEFKDELFLIIHLGMSGTLHLIKENYKSQNSNLSFYHSARLPKKHNHILFNFRNFKIIFNDPRRFGFLKLIKSKNVLNHYFSKLGPDPFEKSFSFKYLNNYIHKKTKNIKNTLLDQKFISGIGNIYASEILNFSKINPLKPCGKLSEDEILKIILYTKRVLKKSIKKGGTTISNFKSIKGNQGAYQKEFRAYDREQESCKNKLCSGIIIKINISNRATYLCNTCQNN